MTKADRVLSTPPTSMSATRPSGPVDPTRRRLLIVAAGGTVAEAIPIAEAAAAAQTFDAELIELGARLSCWSTNITPCTGVGRPRQAHAEHDREFGDPADRDYQDTPEIRAAWEEADKRNGLDDASARRSAIWEEMEPIAKAINAAAVTSIEGLRAKALVAFWEVAPLSAGDTEFSFADAYPFQQLSPRSQNFAG